jgi:hypothetical protein
MLDVRVRSGIWPYQVQVHRSLPNQVLRPNSTQKTSLMDEGCPSLYVVLPTINFRCETKSNKGQ